MPPTITAEIYRPVEDDEPLQYKNPETLDPERVEPSPKEKESEEESETDPKEQISLSIEERISREHGHNPSDWEKMNLGASPQILTEKGLEYEDGTLVIEAISNDPDPEYSSEHRASALYLNTRMIEHFRSTPDEPFMWDWKMNVGKENEMNVVSVGYLIDGKYVQFENYGTPVSKEEEDDELILGPAVPGEGVISSKVPETFDAEEEVVPEGEDDESFEAALFAVAAQEESIAIDQSRDERVEVSSMQEFSTEKELVDEIAFEPIQIPRTFVAPVVKAEVSVTTPIYDTSHAAEIASIDRKYFVPAVNVDLAHAEIGIGLVEATPIVLEIVSQTAQEAVKEMPILEAEQSKTQEVSRPIQAPQAKSPKEMPQKSEPRIEIVQGEQLPERVETPVDASSDVPNKVPEVVKNSPEASQVPEVQIENPSVAMNAQISEALTKVFSEPLIAESVIEKAITNGVTQSEVTKEVPKAESAKLEVAKLEVAEVPTPQARTEIPTTTERVPANDSKVEENAASVLFEQREVIVSARVAPILRMLGIPHSIEGDRQERSSVQTQTTDNFRKTIGNPAPANDDQEAQREPRATNDNSSSLNGITLRRAA
jgi:hypothetical protein